MSNLHIIWESLQGTKAQKVLNDPLSRRVGDLRNIFKLMVHKVAITSKDYCYQDKRRAALKVFCAVLLESKAELDCTLLNRVSHLLSLSEPLGLQELILAARHAERDDVMVTCAQRLLLCPEDTAMAESCFVAAQCLNRSRRATDTIELQSQLAAKAATYCSSDCLLDTSELCRLVNLRHLIQKRSTEGLSQDVYQSVSSLGVYQDFTTPILNRDIMKYLSTAQARVLPMLKPAKGTNGIVGLSAFLSMEEAAAVLGEYAKECLSVVQVLRGCRQLVLALYVAYASDSLVQLLFSELAHVDAVAAYNTNSAKYFDELSSQLLVRVMTSNRPEVPDMALATSCLLILGPQYGYKYLGMTHFVFILAV